MSSTEEEFTDFYLEHYGVPGMKWGRRKNQSGSVSKTGQSKKAKEKPIDKARKMSDEELRKKINRIQMEQQYVKLTSGKSEKTKVQQGQQALQNGLRIWGTAAAIYAAVNSPLAKEIRGQLQTRKNNQFSNRMGLPTGS